MSSTTHQCKTCYQYKQPSEFYAHTQTKLGLRLSRCKQCDTQYHKTRRVNRKHEIVEYKGGKCELCEYSKCIAALEFHHLDPSKKDFEIGDCCRKSLENLKKEADKCILVCSNCHKEIHAGVVILEIARCEFEKRAIINTGCE